MSKNQEILEILESCSGDENAAQVKEIIGLWDKSEPFPVSQAKRYIKMQQWSYNKFGFSMEYEIAKTLPKWFLKVFFDMKEFKSNPRNELTSSCEALSKINGYPMTTQEDKAFCQYDYSLRKYFEEV